MPAASNVVPIQQGEGMKPHYLCNKGECLTELKDHGVSTHKDLTVQELRVLLREARKAAGLIVDNKDPTIMDEIKKGNKEELRLMCSNRGLEINTKTTIGEMRLALRQFVLDNGNGETVYKIGKHSGATFLELLHNHPSYLEWAQEEVQRSSDPDWRLVQLARWAHKMDHNKSLWEEPKGYVSQKTATALQENMTRKNPEKFSLNTPKQVVATEEKKETEQGMMEMMKTMMVQIHTLSEELKEVKANQSTSQSSKNRKTTTTSMEFEEVEALKEEARKEALDRYP